MYNPASFRVAAVKTHETAAKIGKPELPDIGPGAALLDGPVTVAKEIPQTAVAKNAQPDVLRRQRLTENKPIHLGTLPELSGRAVIPGSMASQPQAGTQNFWDKTTGRHGAVFSASGNSWIANAHRGNGSLHHAQIVAQAIYEFSKDAEAVVGAEPLTDKRRKGIGFQLVESLESLPRAA